ALAQRLLDAGAIVVAHDPVAMEKAKAHLGERVSYVAESYEAANDADALVIATDWNEYKQLDFSMLRKLMNQRFIFDFRNIYDPERVVEQGFVYQGVGRQPRQNPSSGSMHVENAMRRPST
ncbi:MAG: UDP-glucose 6-dehydrogenase, partial [bacterium]|nr:UDP-glucose 6-dehydrogenase [bacterium]